ncbi:hypothetical protein Plim_0280 [Planctopirus limnophila DSM 3776]|uniref:Uncharacterized protein n=2 Tax=Planctomycetaceae TaxID=126 RepID=D5SNX6_PLAL2|nr:hypothetical protein Plim_0280 [Planctopirus limnophila DSM 3776]
MAAAPGHQNYLAATRRVDLSTSPSLAICRVLFMTQDFSRKDASTQATDALLPLLQHLRQSLQDARHWEEKLESLFVEWREQQLTEYAAIGQKLEQISQRLGSNIPPMQEALPKSVRAQLPVFRLHPEGSSLP